MANLFGWELKRKAIPDAMPSFVPKETDDGAVVVAAGGAYGTYVDLDGTVRTEAELVTKYREMALQPEVDAAIDEIVNESFSIDEPDIVNINLDNMDVSATIKNAIRSEFQNVLNILNFQNNAYDLYRRWYIDGRLYYHVIIDDKDTKAGIKEVRYVDPRKIRKIREVAKKRVAGGDGGEAMVPRVVNEYYIFNEKGFNFGNRAVGPSTTGLRIAKDAVVHITSGLTDTNGTMVLSYMHKAIKPLNQLRTMEDSLVIYRIARAPERRIWYIDVGNLPKMKAEQYVRDLMTKHKNRLIYDGSTGEVRDDRKFMTMLEDYWLPRREGGRGTEVTTLPGGQTLGELDDVVYFQKKLYQTLNVPINRLNSETPFTLGRATEITRDEIKFSKFITRLRGRFGKLFTSLLERQVVLKQIMSIEDWTNISQDIKYDFSHDSYFRELKDAEVLTNRVTLMSNMVSTQMIGQYYSHEWARKNVLMQSEEEIEELDAQIAQEQVDPRWAMTQETDENGNPVTDPNVVADQGSPSPPSPPARSSPEEMGDPESARRNKLTKIHQAEVTVDLLKHKKDRSMQEEAKYRSAVQILARIKK